ncbi:NTPase [Pseudonocardiaceae bacterium YIM PH 21723]|nr:NTPase [Pseudonocardiaceae bacterium YIM PH 21723]
MTTSSPRTVRETPPAALSALRPVTSINWTWQWDDELNEALAVGLTLLIFDENSGARRFAYELLIRNMADASLLVNPVSSALQATSGTDAVIWLDSETLEAHPLTSGQLHKWIQSGGRRLAVVFVSERALDAPLLQVLQDRSTRVLHMDIPSISSEQVSEPQRHSAGYHADTDGGVDTIGVDADVRMLSDLVASRLIEPPLSIGLFGDWGSGKSFFMQLMQTRVQALADAAREAESATNQRGRHISTYCSSVRQITFNAWHYTEANLWASLATQIFDHLAAESSQTDLERRADDLAEARKSEDSLLGQLSTVRMERMLVSAKQSRDPLATTEKLLDSLSEQDKKWISKKVGISEPSLEDLRKLAEQSKGLAEQSKGLWRWLRKDPVAGGILVAGVIAVAVLAYLRPDWGWLAGAATLVTWLTTGIGRARLFLKRITDITGRFDEPSEETSKRLSELDSEVDRLEQAVAELAPTRQITGFAEHRMGSQDYQRHLGLVSLLRRDLETFAAMLKREKGDGIERIVLYIDDLDRCPPKVVVQVLEAIHLILAMPVFTVVVGVDARWLTRAIEQHYAEMQDGDRPLAANYLEKIFQVPFALQPMGESGFAQFVRGLADAQSKPAAEPAPEQAAPESVILIEPTPAEPAPTNREPADEPAVDLLPGDLVMSPAELEYLSGLGSLVPTPRAAKRLVNLYRLLRARFHAAELDEFLAPDDREAPHRAVMVLLAVLVGCPDTALFRVLAEADAEAEVQQLLGPVDAVLRDRLLTLLATPDGPPHRAGSYQRWLPLVRRFAFPT